LHRCYQSDILLFIIWQFGLGAMLSTTESNNHNRNARRCEWRGRQFKL
jgi:hypothetical protein